MKSLNEYTDQAQNNLFEKTGSFFAFSKKQLDRQKKEGVEYTSLGYGMICPKDNAVELINGLDSINSDAIKLRINEYGINKIIQYELGNYECQITMDYSDAYDVLKEYGVNDGQMRQQFKIFMAYCRKHDLF